MGRQRVVPDLPVLYRKPGRHGSGGSNNFSVINSTVIEDVAGLRTREDNRIELDLINIDFEPFMVDNIRYRDKDLAIVWDKVDGTQHYGSPARSQPL